MKIHNLIIKNNDVVESVKEAAINSAFTYSRLYQILHKQFWEKDRLREQGKGHIKLKDGTIKKNDGSKLFTGLDPRINTLDYTIMYKGKKCKAILFYNLEHMSRFGYDPLDLRATGIASLFNEQKPTEDLKGGDDLDYDVVNLTLKDEKFNTKMFKNPSFRVRYVIGYESGEYGSEPIYKDRYVLKYSPYGDVLISNVERIDNYSNKNDYVDTTVNIIDKTNIIIESFNCYMPPHNDSFFGPGIEFGVYKSSIFPKEYGQFEQYDYYIKPTFDKKFGTVVTTKDVSQVVYKVTSDDPPDNKTLQLASKKRKARVYIFSSGLAIQVKAPITYIGSDMDGDDRLETRRPTMTRLPLMYEDTGDLVMNRYDFIENWSDMFEVYVHNRDSSPWWKDVIGIVVMFVVVLVTYGAFTAGAISATVAVSSIVGTVVGTIGSMSGNRLLQGIGIVLAIYSAYKNVAEQGLAQSYQSQGLSTQTAKFKARVDLMEMGFGKSFSYFLDGLSVSTLSGMSNMLSMSNSIHGLILLVQNETEKMSNEEKKEEEKKGSYYIEEQEDEITDYVNDIMDLSSDVII